MAEEIAKFRFKGYKILKSNIEIKDDSNIDGSLEVEFSQVGGHNVEENEYKLTLDAHIADKNNEVSISVNAVGLFEFDSNIAPEKLNIFFNVNAPAIMFPYIRAYISTLSALSGIKPIILPTLNISKREGK
ncbi:protein translocase subunit secB [Bacteroidia bacterium]|nr:protein translocase subunit secB [Bacteroidia bacterium]